MMEKVRKKPQKDILLIGLAIGCVIAVIAMIVVLCLPKANSEPAFVPPPFEANAVVGVPEVSEDRGYSQLYQEGMAYRVGICGDVRVVGTEAEVYLTNSAENNVWLKLRVLGAEGEILGETGLIKPGEYVRAVTLQTTVAQGETVMLKIMSYEPETYHSLGAVTLTPKISIAAE